MSAGKPEGFFDSAEQQVPEMGKAPPCPRADCPGELGWEVGFGLAGGGYGAYHYCGLCNKVVDKNQEKFE